MRVWSGCPLGSSPGNKRECCILIFFFSERRPSFPSLSVTYHHTAGQTNRLGGKYQTSLSFNVALEEGRDTDQEERERERENEANMVEDNN